jgi:hypothetical protein
LHGSALAAQGGPLHQKQKDGLRTSIVPVLKHLPFQDKKRDALAKRLRYDFRGVAVASAREKRNNLGK